MAIKIHHLNCGSFCARQVVSLFKRPKLCCHCLLVEAGEKLILVDTGLSDLFLKQSGLMRQFLTQANIDLGQNAVDQLSTLGFKPNDVTDIIATHVDQDHIGALHEFARARLHVHESEMMYFQSSYNDKLKRFSKVYFKNNPEVITYSEFGESWFGFHSSKQLRGLPPEIILVPLTGHTQGHTGVAINENGTWLLHAGDAYFVKEDLELNILKKNFKSELFQSLDAAHNNNRILNQRKLAELHHSNPEIQIINSHDPDYFS